MSSVPPPIPPSLATRFKVWSHRYGSVLLLTAFLVLVLHKPIAKILKGDFSSLTGALFMLGTFAALLAVLMVPVVVASHWRDHQNPAKRYLGILALWIIVLGIGWALYEVFIKPLLPGVLVLGIPLLVGFFVYELFLHKKPRSKS